ncbi:response regulator of citrate/malate metabolism [Desulfosporosinus acidiphilus SJ4]|uniref:Response regulator of citrate/malate metabolism n=1 Tax=Desulfosporosinus acidiphilus (strain DSM 22704 / JCM 16185 / SJ4) TaxID=646529 RepID=I4D5Y6_DESAJ|nr:cache domain-containing protein [Desulfosporosinus acidiphilus]AFM41210.1 response regulator of citrate/malate metabolism [Desulfosporosinus acidiphilus SJ4]
MHSLKHQILLLMLGSLILLAASFIFVFGWYMKERAVEAAIVKAETDLETCMDIINVRMPGPWQIKSGILYKGDVQVSYQTELVDHLSELTGDTVTLFLGDTRTATTVRDANGKRAIGTKVSDVVAQTVLKNGQTYLGEANVVGQLFQTAYEPIRDSNGEIIGIFYVGISKNYTQAFIVNSLIRLSILGLGLTLIVIVLTWFFIQRVIIHPLREITLGTRDVATGHATEKVNVTGPREIGDLAVAFNQMVERLSTIADEMSKVTIVRESKEDLLEDYEVIGSLEEGLENEFKEPNPENKYNEEQKVYKNRVEINPSLDASLDEVFEHKYLGRKGLPKGLNVVTLRQILTFLRDTDESVSAETVAEGVKLTRVTVRRYLDYLEQCSVLGTELKYGTVGRPVKLFHLIQD